MATIDRDGVSIHYQVAGDGPPILLSHGYGATSRMWDGQVAAFQDRFRVITWDMRGHGETDYPDDQAQYSEALTVADMAAILDACGAESAVIGGLSLGGYMSAAFHLAHPDRTRALMLFDTGPGYKNDAARTAWNERAEQRAQKLLADGLDAVGGSDEQRLTEHRNAEGLARAARGMLSQFGSRVIESLPSIAVPTLVLVGANDERFLAPTDYMAHKISGATKVVIPDAGHAANLHQPALFNDAMESFLATLPAA
jgi:pimeloyl-ACP methyl ester carboxylesterase